MKFKRVPTFEEWLAEREYEWMERAAIREFDAGQTREEAERAAKEEQEKEYNRCYPQQSSLLRH